MDERERGSSIRREHHSRSAPALDVWNEESFKWRDEGDDDGDHKGAGDGREEGEEDGLGCLKDGGEKGLRWRGSGEIVLALLVVVRGRRRSGRIVGGRWRRETILVVVRVERSKDASGDGGRRGMRRELGDGRIEDGVDGGC